MNKHIPLSSLLLVLGLTGCMTARIDTPVTEDLPLISGAPTVALSVRDSRTKDTIGKIALQIVKVKQSDFGKLTATQFKKYLHAKNLNVSVVQKINFVNPEGIRETLKTAKADGLLYVEINSLHVESIDIILDEPQYELSGLVVLYDKTGKSIFNVPISSRMGSRAVYWKAKGETVTQLLKMAMLDLTSNSKFEKVLREIKPTVSEEAGLNADAKPETV